MDEEFIFQATEEELAEFPEQGGTEKTRGGKLQRLKRHIPERSRKGKYTFTIRSKTTKIVCYQQKWPV